MSKKNQHTPEKGAREADPETLGTSDPQEHMKGPISSFMQKVKDGADHNDNTEKEKEKHEHKKNTSGGDFISK